MTEQILKHIKGYDRDLKLIKRDDKFIVQETVGKEKSTTEAVFKDYERAKYIFLNKMHLSVYEDYDVIKLS